MFDSHFNLVNSFTDPKIPAGFAPVNLVLSPPFPDLSEKAEEFLTLVNNLLDKAPDESVLTIQAGEDRFVLEPGGAAAVPMGLPHTFCVESETAHVLVLSTPAGLERMVRDASVPAAAPLLPPEGTPRPSAEELEQIFHAHGQVNLGPPLAAS